MFRTTQSLKYVSILLCPIDLWNPWSWSCLVDEVIVGLVSPCPLWHLMQRIRASLKTMYICYILNTFISISISHFNCFFFFYHWKYKIVASLFHFHCLTKILSPTLLSEVLTFIALSYLVLDVTLELVLFLFTFSWCDTLVVLFKSRK